MLITVAPMSTACTTAVARVSTVPYPPADIAPGLSWCKSLAWIFQAELADRQDRRVGRDPGESVVRARARRR